MKLLRLFASAALLTTLGSVAVACSSPSGNNNNTGSANPDTACEQYATALRGYFDRCLPGVLPFDEARMKALCLSGLTLNGTGLTAQHLGPCGNALKDLSCDAPVGETEACRPPPGKFAPGAACWEDEQCSTTHCKGASGSTCGVCTARLAVGSTCGPQDECAVGASCLSGKCVAEVKSAAGGGCDELKNESCQAGLYCDSTARTCKPYVTEGGACSAELRCARELRCDSTSNKCVKQVLAAEGQACGADAVRCQTGLGCDPTTSKCVKVTMVAPGGDCSGTFTRCTEGRCIEGTNKCPMVVADGGACTEDSSTEICAFGADCIDGKCLLPAQVVCK